MTNPDGGDVLVIGAGSGNDVASALRRDADHVDAVEIDPRLMEIAEDSHPKTPTPTPGSRHTSPTGVPTSSAPTSTGTGSCSRCRIR